MGGLSRLRQWLLLLLLLLLRSFLSCLECTWGGPDKYAVRPPPAATLTRGMYAAASDSTLACSFETPSQRNLFFFPLPFFDLMAMLDRPEVHSCATCSHTEWHGIAMYVRFGRPPSQSMPAAQLQLMGYQGLASSTGRSEAGLSRCM